MTVKKYERYESKDIGARHMLYKQYQRGAIRRGYEFSLTYEVFDLAIHNPCTYCGRIDVNRITYTPKKYPYYYNGIDRIDNTKGYALGNIQTVCGQCNKAKGILTTTEFDSWITAIIKHRTRREVY